MVAKKKAKAAKPYKTMWQLTNELFELYLEIDKNNGRHTPLLMMQLKALEKEINARDES